MIYYTPSNSHRNQTEDAVIWFSYDGSQTSTAILKISYNGMYRVGLNKSYKSTPKILIVNRNNSKKSLITVLKNHKMMH